MTDRDPVDEPLGALERSLREGPADEGGYRAEAIAFDAVAPGRSKVEQSRRPWVRLRRRAAGQSSVFSFASSVALMLVLLLGGVAVIQRIDLFGSGQSPLPSAIGSPGVSASPIPVPALTETFVSPRNGFSVRCPADWTTKAATTSWRPGTFVPIGNSALDELQLHGAARLVVASQKLAAGQTEASWIASFFQPYELGSCNIDRALWPRLAVDGQLGYLDVEACPAPADRGFSSPDLRFDLIVFSGGRVYEIGLDGSSTAPTSRPSFRPSVSIPPARSIRPRLPEPRLVRSDNLQRLSGVKARSWRTG